MVVSGRLPKSHSVLHRMLLASDSEPQQAGGKKRNKKISSFNLFACLSKTKFSHQRCPKEIV